MLMNRSVTLICRMSSPKQSPSGAQVPSPTETQSVITGKTLTQMLFYTFLMVTLPISSYFVSKKMVFQDIFGYSSDDSVVPSALTAVVMVHVVLGLFIYAAYTEEIPAKPKRD